MTTFNFIEHKIGEKFNHYPLCYENVIVYRGTFIPSVSNNYGSIWLVVTPDEFIFIRRGHEVNVCDTNKYLAFREAAKEFLSKFGKIEVCNLPHKFYHPVEKYNPIVGKLCAV